MILIHSIAKLNGILLFLENELLINAAMLKIVI